MLDFLIDIDTQIYLFFNGMHTPLLDRFMMLFTGRFIWIPMYVALAIMLLKTFGAKLAGIYLIAIGVAIALTDQTCATFIRPAVARLRPSNPANPLSAMAVIVDGYRGGRYGFPSCHSANSFALATFIGCLIRRPKFVAFIIIWAVLNSYTRLYLGVHYPGDLLIGAIIGSGFGYLCYRVARHIEPSHRHASLDAMGNPIFSIPTGMQLSDGQNATIGITVGDMTIAVGIATILYIMASCLIV